MKITSFYFKELINGGWEIGPIQLKKTNLFVGISGSGKTRTLNSLFNIGCFVARNQAIAGAIECKISIETNGDSYQWRLVTDVSDSGGLKVVAETLVRTNINSTSSILIDRGEESFKFNSSSLPKLDPSASALYLLREEDEINLVYTLFTRIIRRRFQGDALDQQMAVQNIPKIIEDTYGKSKSLKDLPIDFSVNGKLYLLNKYDHEKFKLVVENYKSVFPKINDCIIGFVDAPAGATKQEPFPVVMMKEEDVAINIMSTELSSGMQKVLSIITDIITIPEDMIYLVDEYENSLGVNAIDFLPSLLADYSDDKQIVITTHHPYLINKMPIKDWIVFNRRGSCVYTLPGEDFKNRYSSSKQQAFVQLLNDPAYTELGG